MLLSEPAATAYDIKFSFLGFPVRVHPAFFIMPLVLGSSFLGDSDLVPGVALLIVTAVFFVSILVHELGHALAFRYYGQDSRIVLYWMGGLAIPDRPRFGFYSSSAVNPYHQIVISIAGPLFGFLLAGLLAGIANALGANLVFSTQNFIPLLIAQFPQEFLAITLNKGVAIFLYFGIIINVFLNILNLAPVYPLDGGQVARQVFRINDPANSEIFSLWLSVIVGGLIAVVSFQHQSQFIGIFFGFMAWSNYMTIRQMGGGYGNRPW